MKIFAYYLDMIKDIILVSQMIILIGGTEYIYKNPTNFTSTVSETVYFDFELIQCRQSTDSTLYSVWHRI